MPKGIYKRIKHWKLSEATKEKLRKEKIGNTNGFQKGNKINLGRKRPDMAGKNNPKWKGGISDYDRKLYLNGRRRALKKNAKGFHTQGEWERLKAQYNWICLACGKREPKIKLTEDDIIPLSKCGSDNIENIQPLCRSCNCKKYNKIKRYV